MTRVCGCYTYKHTARLSPVRRTDRQGGASAACDHRVPTADRPPLQRLEIFMVAIVNFRGPKLAFESLYWDQASALIQREWACSHRLVVAHAAPVGLLDPKGLPCAGAAVGRKGVLRFRCLCARFSPPPQSSTPTANRATSCLGRRLATEQQAPASISRMRMRTPTMLLSHALVFIRQAYNCSIRHPRRAVR